MEILVTNVMNIIEIKLKDRFISKIGTSSHPFINWFMSMDGNDCPITKPNGFKPTFYSKKTSMCAINILSRIANRLYKNCVNQRNF